jgi:hypothetical protein
MIFFSSGHQMGPSLFLNLNVMSFPGKMMILDILQKWLHAKGAKVTGLFVGEV